ncbi:Ig-like domain-containing protein [Myxococcota bacterium]|nr:Ig-like domain-containing protein [Myxococcota bacterium]
MKRLSLPALALFAVACQPSVATMSVEPTLVTLRAKGESVAIKATPLNEEGQLEADALTKLEWTSSNVNVATVVAGTVTAVGSGESIVTAKIGEVVASARVRVSIPAKVALEPRALELAGLGKSGALTAKVVDERGTDAIDPQLSWTTSSSTIATVAAGKVDAVGIGRAVISVKVGTLTATAAVDVHHPVVDRIEIAQGPRELEKVGDAVRLSATLFDPKGEVITGLPIAWTTSDEKLATVSSEGLVTAVKRGKVKIVASAQDKTAEVEIVIKGL